MIKKVEQYCERYHMVEKGDRIVLGVSGGADSVSLFFVMLELCEKYNIEIVVVHVNHGIRGDEAKRDEDYVRELCGEYGIAFECVNADVRKMAKESRLSEEEMGRKVRYDAFAKVAKKYGCNKVAVAHNQNDVSETVLLNLFRGSGIKGLSGMEPVRDGLIRPLLCVKRNEIEAFLESRKISYQNDHTNFETDYTRNKIRLKVLPYVEEKINERASEHIVKSAEILSMAYDYIGMQTDAAYQELVTQTTKEWEISLQGFHQLHDMIKTELVRRVLFKIAKKQKDIEMTHVEIVVDLAGKGAGKRVDLPYEMEAVHQYDKLVLRKRERKKQEDAMELEVPIPGKLEIPGRTETIEFEIITVNDENREALQKMYANKKNDYTKWFDYDKIRNTVLVRNRKNGDYFEYNADGNRKELKRLFIDQKLPAEKRDRILLLADGNHIMWAIGLRISEYYKVQECTKRILKVKVDGGNEHD